MRLVRVPFVAIGLLIGGAFFVFLGAILMATIGLALALVGAPHAWRLLFGFLVAGLIVLTAILLWAFPTARVAWGALAIVLAVLSVPFAALGGFVIGFLLTAAGGIVAIAWRPPRAPTAYTVPM
jgi:hypothetical protein